MPFECPKTYSSLLRVVARVSPEASIQEDLLQEALVHLWQLKIRSPGQSPSWYLKSCQFHLHNLLRKGRSIDSHKRLNGRVCALDPASGDPSGGGDANALSEELSSEESIFAQVCADEILGLLTDWLGPEDRLILDRLADGFSVREVASNLKLSHTTVIKRRRKIASLALLLGILPLSNERAVTLKIQLRPTAGARQPLTAMRL